MSDAHEQYLSKFLRKLVRVAGFDAALKLVERFGGIRVFIPAEEHLHAEHPIVQAVGIEAAKKLSRDRDLAKDAHDVPRAAAHMRRVRDLLMREEYRDKSASQLARGFGMTRRNVFLRLKKTPKEEEADLFKD